MEESVVRHLFLTHKLPSSNEKDYLIEANFRNQHELLEVFREFLHSSQNLQKLSVASKLHRCFQRWLSIQNPYQRSGELFESLLEELENGDMFPIYFHAQNAAILIESDAKLKSGVLLSAWQVSLPNKTITESIYPQFSVFPTTKYYLANKKELVDKANCELIMEFFENTISYFKSTKSSEICDETRDIVDSRYILEWWIQHFKSISIVENSNNVSFKKKHRDQIRWKDSLLPFRRSGIWMTIKVVLAMLCTQHFRDDGILIYKLLLTDFLVHVTETMIIGKMDEGILVHAIRKIMRRMDKIEMRIRASDYDTKLQGWITSMKENIEYKLKSFIPKPNCVKPIRNNTRILELDSLENDEIHHHQLQQFNEYFLNNIVERKSDIQNLTIVSIPTAVEKLPVEIELSISESEFECLLGSYTHDSAIKILRSYETYRYKVVCNYCKNGNNPIGYSRFILTSLKIISTMHAKLCEDHRYNMLADHKIKIRHMETLIEHLLLPDKDMMIEARRLLDYFQCYSEGKRLGLLESICDSDSFGVRFASLSPKMLRSLEDIRSKAESDRNDKIRVIQSKQLECQRLLELSAQSECQCSSFTIFNSCSRCSFLEQARSMCEECYERPIPLDQCEALAVIFELQMPIEIRCYREILWLFNNRTESEYQNHLLFDWLKIPPYSEKLKPFNECPPNFKVKLVSSKKSITQTHYNHPKPVMSTSVDQYLFECSLEIQIAPICQRKFELEQPYITLSIDDSDYKSLESSIQSTDFRQNEVIAKVMTSSSKLTPDQFIEFGSFRSGHLLQWWNLLINLETYSLPIHEEPVVILILQSILQLGPKDTDASSIETAWCSQSHKQLLNDNFVDEILHRLNRCLEDCCLNWQNELILVLIICITMRIFTLADENKLDSIKSIIFKCRKIAKDWVHRIEEHIQHLPSVDDDEMQKLHNKIVNMTAACILTYFTHQTRINHIISTSEHVGGLLFANIHLHDHLSHNETPQMQKISLTKILIRWSYHVMHVLQPIVTNVLKKDSYTVLNEFSTDYWSAVENEQCFQGNWKKRHSSSYDGWYDGQYKSRQLSINFLQGVFLVDGMTVSRLPTNITSHPNYVRTFGNHIFHVQFHSIIGTYITKHAYHNGQVKYTFHLNFNSGKLTIVEINKNSENHLELIPCKLFLEELPDFFVSNFSHWMSSQKQELEFRPVHFQDQNFLDCAKVRMDMNTRLITLQKGDVTEKLISRSSILFTTLYEQILYRLDDIPYVYLTTKYSYMHRAKRIKQEKIQILINIYYSRLRLSFEYDISSQTIKSNEYLNMYIAHDQSFGTLTGLERCLLLSTGQNGTVERSIYRKLLVPLGKININKNDSNEHHQMVNIERPIDMEFSDCYHVFIMNDHLRTIQSNDSPQGWLFLALLHAVTSGCLSDEYTGMTGMERAFELLKSAGCWSDKPYDKISLNILYQIAFISPRVDYYPKNLKSMISIKWRYHQISHSLQNFAYWLLVEKLIITSKNFNFMHSSEDMVKQENDEQALLPKNNRLLLAKLYWDYRDSYNPVARLPKEIENEIPNWFSHTIYQPYVFKPIHLHGSESNAVQEISNLYKIGDMNLKDIDDLDIFPLCRWNAEEFSLKNVWVGLLKYAIMTRKASNEKNQIKVRKFEMLLDFLQYINRNKVMELTCLELLERILCDEQLLCDSIVFPRFCKYKSIERVKVEQNYIHFPKRMKQDKRNEILTRIEACFTNGTRYTNTPDLQINQISPYEINEFLESWRTNSKFHCFLATISSIFASIKIKMTKTLICITAQKFNIENESEHHQIKLRVINEITDRNLLELARRKYTMTSSVNFNLQSREHTQPEVVGYFPENIFHINGAEQDDFPNLREFYQEKMRESWQMLREKEFIADSEANIEPLVHLLEATSTESKKLWKHLCLSFSPRECLYIDTGVTERMCCTTLIAILLQTWLKTSPKRTGLNLTPDQQILLGAFLVDQVLLQYLERLLDLARRKVWYEFHLELNNLPHSNWTPSSNLPWVIFQLERNITIRKLQVDVARHLMNPEQFINQSNRHFVMQMNMGEGKTSVIVPMLIMNLSSTSLVRLVVLKSLFHLNYHTLRVGLGGLLNHRVFPFLCHRRMDFNKSHLDILQRRFQNAFTNSHVVITSPEDILSFDLLAIDKCRKQDFNSGACLLSTQNWLKINARDILDESDEILHVKYQLVYTVGCRYELDGGVERWKIIQHVLKIIKHHARSFTKLYEHDVTHKSSKQPGAFPLFQLLSDKPSEHLCQIILKDYIQCKKLNPSDSSLVQSFLSDTTTSLESIENHFSKSQTKEFLMMRGLLAMNILTFCLKKRHRVHYGIHPDRSLNRRMAVPFRAKDVASEKNDFGHMDVALLLTNLSYYYNGLKDDEMMLCFDHLIYKDKYPKAIYDEWIQIGQFTMIHDTIKDWRMINLKDSEQTKKYLFPSFRYNTSTIDYYLNLFVFPREAKQFSQKITASGWDISNPRRIHSIIGFSGTNDTELLLPVHIHQNNLSQLQMTNALVLHNILKQENNYFTWHRHINTYEMLSSIVQYRPNIHVILDVGALFIDGTNRDIATHWLQLSDKSTIDYAIYFESNSVAVCDRYSHSHAFSTSPAAERLDRCVIYIDEIHCRGTDFKFPDGFKAVVTLGVGLTKDRLAQACMRMRKLGRKHSVIFWSSNEVHTQITEMRSSQSEIDSMDVIRWAYRNTQQSIWEGLHHWMTQSWSYMRKSNAFQAIQWNDVHMNINPSKLVRLCNEIVENETIDLKDYFGNSHVRKTLIELYDGYYSSHRDNALSDVSRHIRKHLLLYGGYKKRLCHTYNEEQEKETEKELEEERQIKKPPASVPCEPTLHKEVDILCQTTDNSFDLSRFPEVFRPLRLACDRTTFECQFRAAHWSPELWITTEFQNVIKNKGEQLDSFLRPPRWVIVYGRKYIILISPFEANHIINQLSQTTGMHSSSNSCSITLRILLPRARMDQSIFINTEKLTIPVSISARSWELFYKLPKHILMQLFIFNGTIYFNSIEEQTDFCRCLVLCPKPRSQREEAEYHKGNIDSDGFVHGRVFRDFLGIKDAIFDENPLSWIRKLIEQRIGYSMPHSSHVGSLIYLNEKACSSDNHRASPRLINFD